MEPTVSLYLSHVVEVFREVRRVLRPDGVLWLNMGDSYHSGDRGAYCADTTRWSRSYKQRKRKGEDAQHGIQNAPNRLPQMGLKDKDLVGMPWRVALALQADGWWLRRDIIWEKNPMPESVNDRSTSAHEYIFMMTKRSHYYYDALSIAEPCSEDTHARYARGRSKNHKARVPSGWDTGPGNHRSLVGRYKQNASMSNAISQVEISLRNKRSVWKISTEAFSGFAFDLDSADYVDAHGKPYRASKDCLIHGHLVNRRSQQKNGGGEQLCQKDLRSLDIDAHLLAKLAYEACAKLPIRNALDCRPESVHGQTLESVAANKSSIVPLCHEPDQVFSVEQEFHTSHTSTQSTLPFDILGCSDQNSVLTANDHNNQNHKTARVLQNLDNASEETSFHTVDRKSQFEQIDSVAHNDANNNEGDFLIGETESCPSAQSLRHNEGISSLDATCKCHISQHSHFATFPRALIMPMILASTSEKGACPNCRAPWKRIVRSRKMLDGVEWAGERMWKGNRIEGEADGLSSAWGFGHQRLMVERETAGWKATCKCVHSEKDLVPCIVFDSFVGSGTVPLVARDLGRMGVGLDLGYQKLSSERIYGPLFAGTINSEAPS